MNNKKILFISHDAIQAGAPILLLTFLRWFKKNSNIPFSIILRNGGELQKKFEELATVSVFNKENYHSNKFFNRIFSIPLFHTISKKNYLLNLYKQIARNNIKLIYSNTITNGEILHFLSNLNIPVITHVHELEYWINHTGKTNFDYIKQYSKHYIAVSQAVKSNLILNHDIPENKIDVIHGFIPQTNINANCSLNDVKLNITNELGIENNSIIVGACGPAYWAKGPDLFIQLARLVHQKYSDMPIHFIWMGSTITDGCYKELQHDIRNTGLEKYIHFIGHKPDPSDYMAGFDIFTLVSREDSFPLVCLEAASLGKPVLCFDKAGGAPEFVQDDVGFVVPYLDINAMSQKVIHLCKNETLRKQLGNQAAIKVKRRHDISVIAPKILKIISNFIT